MDSRDDDLFIMESASRPVIPDLVPLPSAGVLAWPRAAEGAPGKRGISDGRLRPCWVNNNMLTCYAVSRDSVNFKIIYTLRNKPALSDLWGMHLRGPLAGAINDAPSPWPAPRKVYNTGILK